MNESPSEAFGQYQLIEKIAQGGMAEIFKGKAVDLHGIERTVVIKRILPHIAASPEFVDMLIDEAKIAVMLSHGNIAQIYDLGKVADDYFIVMEYVEGRTLSQIVKRLRSLGNLMPVPYAVSLIAEVANGLDYMHRKTDEQGTPLHIIHRDISPQNIILSTSGTVKIIDFGIAKAKTKVSTTDSGILKGKFAYMSPEHAEGERLDHRSDLFSLGVILFELLTGERLFKGKNNAETIRKVKKAKVPSPSSRRPGVPRVLDEIVQKALQRDRDKRYPSAHAFSQDLTRFLIQHHPDFSPRDLVRFLQELFPELAPMEAIAQEETHRVPLTIAKEGKKEGHDETVAADSAVIRQKLKEAEVFDLPEPKAPPPPEEEGGGEEKTFRLPIRRLFRTFLALAAVGGLILGGLYLYHIYKHRKISAPPSSEEEPLKPPMKPPKPPPTTLAVTPLRPPTPQFGSLIVDSRPPGARIFLNDVDTNKKTPSVLGEIPARAEQKVGLHLERYKFWEGKVQVDAGQSFKLLIPMELNYGDLEINSLPPGAEVILNGRPAGKTPFRQAHLPPDTSFQILLRLEGYETWEGPVKIFGGKTEVINTSLKKRPLEETLPE